MMWINVKDELPLLNECVWIAFIDFKNVDRVEYGWRMDDDSFRYWDGLDLETLYRKVTHWMPVEIPEFPREMGNK